jgi:hypothetical protein
LVRRPGGNRRAGGRKNLKAAIFNVFPFFLLVSYSLLLS